MKLPRSITRRASRAFARAGGVALAAALAGSGGAVWALDKPDYVPLAYIPGLSDNALTPGLIDFMINQFFYLLIWVLAVIAVVMITFYGLTWILSEVVPEKVNAKERILEIIFGLVLVLGTYIILATINPNILNLDVWKEVRRVKLPEVNVQGVKDLDGTSTTRDTRNDVPLDDTP